MDMEKVISPTGIPVLKFDEKTYINFGSEDPIEWITISVKGDDGRSARTVIDPLMRKIPRKFSTKLGKETLTNLKKHMKPYIKKNKIRRIDVIKVLDEIIEE